MLRAAAVVVANVELSDIILGFFDFSEELTLQVTFAHLRLLSWYDKEGRKEEGRRFWRRQLLPATK